MNAVIPHTINSYQLPTYNGGVYYASVPQGTKAVAVDANEFNALVIWLLQPVNAATWMQIKFTVIQANATFQQIDFEPHMCVGKVTTKDQGGYIQHWLIFAEYL